MMTSSNGNIFRIAGPLWEEFTGWSIPLTKASNETPVTLRRHLAHCDLWVVQRIWIMHILIFMYIYILSCWLFNRIDIITTFVQSKSLVYVSTCKKLYKVTMKEGRKSKTFYIILISRVYPLFDIDRLSATWQLDHWNINAIFTKFSLLSASKVVKMTTSDASRDENFIKMTTFPSQWCKMPLSAANESDITVTSW